MKKWTLKIEMSVSDNWIADGFNASERLEQIEELLAEKGDEHARRLFVV